MEITWRVHGEHTEIIFQRTKLISDSKGLPLDRQGLRPCRISTDGKRQSSPVKNSSELTRAVTQIRKCPCRMARLNLKKKKIIGRYTSRARFRVCAVHPSRMVYTLRSGFAIFAKNSACAVCGRGAGETVVSPALSMEGESGETSQGFPWINLIFSFFYWFVLSISFIFNNVHLENGAKNSAPMHIFH